MTSAFCLFVFETFVSRLLALFGTIITSESGNPTRPGDKWERKLLVFGIFYSFLTSGRPLSSSTEHNINTVWKAVVLYNYVLKPVALWIFKHYSIGTLFIHWLSRLKTTLIFYEWHFALKGLSDFKREKCSFSLLHPFQAMLCWVFWASCKKQ